MSVATFFRRLHALIFRRQFESELDEEIEHHLAMLKASGQDCGRHPPAREFGPIHLIQEQTREAAGMRAVDDLSRDLKIGVRGLLRRPGFTMVVVLTLAVGVGGSAAIFGVLNGILLKPLPYSDAERVLVIWQNNEKTGAQRQEVAPANFLDWRRRTRAFTRLTALEPYGVDWRSSEVSPLM
jgi:putative ABC transport system permease protein